MSFKQPCQMRFGLSIVAMCFAFSAAANPLVQCPPVQATYSCENGEPTLQISRPNDAANLIYRIGALNADSALGDRMITLDADTTQSTTSLSRLPLNALNLAIVGNEQGGEDACCLRNTVLPAPDPALCKVTEESPKKQSLNGVLEPFDIALDLSLQAECPIGAVGHNCSGTLSLTTTGTPVGPFPLTLEHTVFNGLDLQLSGPLPCYSTGNGSQMCREDAAILGESLTLPITLTAPASYQKRRVEICAELALPQSKRQLVFLVQTAMNQLGIDVGAPDGSDGPKTRAGVAQLAQRFELDTDNPTDPAFLSLLGLNPYSDDIAENNAICATTFLPPQPRPKEPKPSPEPKRPDSPRSTPVIDDNPKLICDPASTVARGGRCACRFTRMAQISPTQCVCETGGQLHQGGCM